MGVARFVSRFAGRFADARGPAGSLGILVPTTYMNLSGQSVGPAAGNLRAAPHQVLVVHDDIDLAFGRVQGKTGGGTGGHNGLKSIRDALGSGDFPRVRLGVGRPGPDFRGDRADWVLQAFTEPRDEVLAMLETGISMVEVVVAEGMEAAIARFHARPPGARAQARGPASPGDDGDAETPAVPPA